MTNKKVDLHRYQVVTVPIEFHKELASLKGPRLSEEDMKPLPPIEHVIREREVAKTRFLAPNRVVALGVVVFALAMAGFYLRSVRSAQTAPAQVPTSAPVIQQIPAATHEATGAELVPAAPSAPASRKPATRGKPAAAAKTKANSDAEQAPTESTKRPPSRAAFKPE